MSFSTNTAHYVFIGKNMDNREISVQTRIANLHEAIEVCEEDITQCYCLYHENKCKRCLKDQNLIHKCKKELDILQNVDRR